MKPVYLDIHIHTSPNPNQPNENYDFDSLTQNIKEVSKDSDFLISLTDHNMVNKSAYLKAVELGINIILGVELHIKNYEECPAYHCHIFFDLKEINSDVIDDINRILDELYPNKVVEKRDPGIPNIQKVINKFDHYDVMLLPHGGQSHATFDKSIPEGTKFDTTLEKSIYYNQFDGFTARGDIKLEKTQEYFKRLGINEFVNLVTCSDNYNPKIYPKGKDENPFKPTWMLAEPTFNGLRLSLSEKSRLFYANEAPKIWTEYIRSVKHEKDNISIDVNLSMGLNVIIGSSSTGKSLLADSLERKLSKRDKNEAYAGYEADKIIVENPSGMVPHYLSQNYIVSIVNDISDNRIESIEIIKRVFPGDDEVKGSINNGLKSFKSNIQNLIKMVQIIEKETISLSKIPIISRLITTENPESNLFKKLVPTSDEKEVLDFSKNSHDTYVEYLDEIDDFLSVFPFIKHDSSLVRNLKEELRESLESSLSEKQVRKIVESERKKYDEYLKQIDSETQSKTQSFEKLLTSLRNYSKAHNNFFETFAAISNYSIEFDSEKIESMGHKLYIGNNFKLNKNKFLEVVNHYLKVKIDSFQAVEPDFFFEENFKKKSPKVHDYDDFERKVFKDFETLNKKTYRIDTKDGRKFEDLSPGWKTSVILDLILGYTGDSSPIIIDQPEDNLATTYINEGLVEAIKKMKLQKQIILVSHNATIPMLGDAQNIVLCRNEENKLIIRSGALEGQIDGRNVVDYIAEITDGGKSAIKKRVKKYNLKKFTEI